MVQGAVPGISARVAGAADNAGGNPRPAVLISLGNEERRDDGIGGYVADLVAAALCTGNSPLIRFDGLEIARIPEIVAASPRAIVIVDAWRQPVEGGYRVLRATDLPAGNGFGHAPDIGEYAALVAAFGCPAEVAAVLVSACDFGDGRGLSAVARRNAHGAARAILDIFCSLREAP